MARTAAETANILSRLYHKKYEGLDFDPFRIAWPQLRSLAAVPCLEKSFLKEVSEVLAETDHCLIPFNNFLLVAKGDDLSHYRMVPDRIVEQYLSLSEDFVVDEDDICDEDDES